MSDMRDYYLENLGVGEIWQLRQVISSALSISGIVDAEIRVASSTDVLTASTPVTDDEVLIPWQKMQSELQQCQACSLCARFGRGVLGSGDVAASIMVITDWAVSDKLTKLEPALQHSEKLMLNMLGALLPDSSQASTRHGIYRTSIIKAQQSEHTQVVFDETASDAAELCKSFLFQQISLVQPRILLVFGEQLGRMLLSVDVASEIKMRQAQHVYHGIPVIVTHDAHFLLASPESKYDVWQDLCRVKHLLS
jgi:uracil-DNA glycosylase family 4